MTKPFYLSRTLWINFIALIALAIQEQFGFIISPEIQGLLLIAANTVIRFYTKKEIE